MRPQTYEPGDSEFAEVAVRQLESFSGNTLPKDVLVARYFLQNNFNDGNELWLLELQSPEQLPKLTTQLGLKRADSNQSLPDLSIMPEWVKPPPADRRDLYVDDKSLCEKRPCKSGITYLWRLNGRSVYLYHIIT